MIGRAITARAIRPLGQYMAERSLTPGFQEAVYTEDPSVRKCGTVKGSSWPWESGGGVACDSWTYSQLVKEGKRRKVVWKGQKLNFYPSPEDLFSKLGICGALKLYESGDLVVPYKFGPIKLEPGTYHPKKSWEQIANDSESLRLGGGGTKWQLCFPEFADGVSNVKDDSKDKDTKYLITLEKWGAGASYGTVRIEDCLLLRQFPGGVMIPEAYTFKVPDKYATNLIALSTAALWLADSKGGGWGVNNQTPGVQGIFCRSGSPMQSVMDPKWQHKYQQQSKEMVQIGPGGYIGQPTTVLWQGPILTVKLKKGQSSYTPNRLQQALDSGQWPPKDAKAAFWEDQRVDFPPESLLFSGDGSEKPGADKPKLAGLATLGLAAGVIALIASVALKRRGDGDTTQTASASAAVPAPAASEVWP